MNKSAIQLEEVEDVVSICRKNRELHPDGEQLILMNREEAASLVKLGRVGRYSLKMQLANVIVPVMISALWIMGARESLVNPVFALISAVVCTVWAVANVKWGNLNA